MRTTPNEQALDFFDKRSGRGGYQGATRKAIEFKFKKVSLLIKGKF